jgi:HAMP domain-containing protein
MPKPKLYDKKALVRLTADELEAAHAKAKKLKLSLSRALVKSLLSNEKMLTADDREEVSQLKAEVRHVGVNLNQIARALNRYQTGNAEQPPPMQEIGEAVKQVNDAVRTLIRKLNK